MDDKLILEEIYLYYSKLYCADKSCNLNEYLNDINCITLEDNDSSSCEGALTALTEKECFDALMLMKNNKCPGSDGLSFEFYKKFWSYIKDLLLESLNEGYKKGTLSDSQRHALLTLLFQKGHKEI